MTSIAHHSPGCTDGDSCNKSGCIRTIECTDCGYKSRVDTGSDTSYGWWLRRAQDDVNDHKCTVQF